MSEYIKTMFSNLISRYRKVILMLADMGLIVVAYTLTWVLISGRADMEVYFSLLVSSCFLFVACFAIVYVATGMYDSLWRYAEVVEFFKCCISSAIAIIAFVIM
ncbi:MAG: polysaccharide biosynthesis protein, partial [Oscillospiraceae bacterium]